MGTCWRAVGEGGQLTRGRALDGCAQDGARAGLAGRAAAGAANAEEAGDAPRAA